MLRVRRQDRKLVPVRIYRSDDGLQASFQVASGGFSVLGAPTLAELVSSIAAHREVEYLVHDADPPAPK